MLQVSYIIPDQESALFTCYMEQMEEISAEKCDSPPPARCVMATAAVWKMLIEGDCSEIPFLDVGVDKFTSFSTKYLQELEFQKL